MTAGQLTAILTAAAGLATAITALVHSIRTRSAVAAARNEPARLPACDAERAEPRDVPMGFSPPDCKGMAGGGPAA